MEYFKINMTLYIKLRNGEIIAIKGYDLLDKVNKIKNNDGWIIIDSYIIRCEDILYMKIEGMDK